MLDLLKQLNPGLTLADVGEKSFMRYGRVLDNSDFVEVEKLMEETKIPTDGNEYVPSVESLEAGIFKPSVEKLHFGGMSIQIGYCNGKNSSLNGLEYHKGSEINVAITDFVLMLGHVNDIESEKYSVDELECFFVPKGTAIEMFQTTLHLAPCKVSDTGFKCVVILPLGTNTPLLEEEKGHDKFLFMRNKWLLSHPENERFMSMGAKAGIIGPNISVIYK
ncbi:DUF4867 family protein [Paenisporosarcina sp. TG-14]|uniref:DUF4867 family protein n=1 Tax=Paenisporosarcina sp. TG-14 TaxID=1231057 RepID=UPI0002EB09A9|nr:DUF4867 family protein [Paenisporosarcina sp. TG-14]